MLIQPMNALKHSIFSSFLLFVLLFVSINSFNQNPFPAATIYTTDFVSNKGQILDQNYLPNPEVLFLLNVKGANIQLHRKGFSYDLYTRANDRNSDSCKFSRIDFELLGINDNFGIEVENINDEYLNYYTHGTRDREATQIHPCSKVVYKNIYPHIDLEFVADRVHGLKYSFILRPQATIGTIKIRISGAKVDLSDGGSLLLSTDIAAIEERIPESYLLRRNKPVPCEVSFARIIENVYGFNLHHERKVNDGLIIDPIPIRQWSSYYGGNEDELRGYCSSDSSGNVYLSGTTRSLNNIATSGSHQAVIGSNDGDAFLVKFDSQGGRVWGTYYGGSGYDEGYDCVAAGAYVYLVGSTNSGNNISTPGSYQPNLVSLKDGFLVKFDTNGQRIWGTYYGGNQNDDIYSVSVSNDEKIYICGQTQSESGISSTGSHQAALGGMYDGFLVKFDSGGVRKWGTYYGGLSQDMCFSVHVHDNQTIYLTGETWSANNISSPGAYQPNLDGYDSFLVRFDSSGNRIWGTYFGGPGMESGRSVSCDSTGSIFLAGRTNSNSGLSTPGSFQPSYGGGSGDGFLSRFDGTGQLVWCSYYGSDLLDRINTCVSSESGNIYIAGLTSSANNIASPNAFQTALAGGFDAFLAKFSRDGDRLWGTYYGSTGNDEGFDLSVSVLDSVPNLFLTGQTTSDTGISTSGSHQPVFGGGAYDCFISLFRDCALPEPAGIITGLDTICKPQNNLQYSIASVPYATGYHWSHPSGASIVSGQNTAAVILNFGPYAQSGIIGVYAYNSCGLGDSSFVFINILQNPTPSISGNDSCCTGQSCTYTTLSGKSQYQWAVSSGGIITGGGTASDTSVTVLWNVPGPQWVSANYTDTNGCAGLNPTIKNVEVTIGIPVHVTIAESSNNICQGNSVTFTATPTNPGSTPVYQWKVNSVNTGTNSPVFTYSPVNGDVVQCILTSSNTVCTSNNPASSNPVSMVVYPNLPVSVSVSPSQNPVCAGTSVTFTATPTNGGTTPSYQWKVNGINVGTNNPSYSYTPLNNDIVTCILTSSETCTSGNPASGNIVTMTGNPLLPVSISISSSSNPFCIGNSVTFTAIPTNGGTNPSYQWKVNGVNVGTNNPTFTYNPVSGDVVTCLLTSSELCTSSNPASSNPVSMIGTVGLPAGISITASPNPFCPGSSVNCAATPMNGGTAPIYQWKVNGINVGTNSPNYSFIPLNNDSVRCIMTSNLSCVSGNPAGSNKITLSGTLAPEVTFTSCFDTITTLNAKPIKLKGGIPLNGTYSGPGVNSTTGIFTPSMAGIGLKTITYSYTNVSLCSASKNKTILVQSTPSFTCGNNMTDIRDNKAYPTVQIGSQCWMAANLNYGTVVNSPQLQYDNCISEKYCYNNLSSNCSSYGGLYSWDELMQYDGSPANQGLCPPGWHIPTEGEWTTLFNFYSGSAFAGKPLQDSIIAGFRALTGGVFYMSTSWKFASFATLFWSSTAWGATRALSHGMNTYNYSVSFYPSSRANAFPARCLKD